jgi:putative ABC transport system substrate-binding protein
VAELAAHAPDVILATGAITVGPLLKATRSIPVVFVIVPDPVGAVFVESLAHPGGNATGFLMFEYGVGAKWLELLKEMVLGTPRVSLSFASPTTQLGTGQWGAIQSVAPAFRVELTAVNVSHTDEIERALADFVRKPNGGLIVTASALAATHRQMIIALAARHKLPAVYYEDNFANGGGLFSYGPDFGDQFRAAADYVDRVKGEKPADLPVQTPTKYELVINLKTAKAMGLTIPPSLLARADEVIE